ncbi:single-stranded nucleic acid binding R3H domain protein [Ammonifex degensii KC4]|uniref:RNA-binding protein KhpB n=1 Tax=Ammonifex degensii (strain DSM 10501 / KC4) TaxID=429009 RepID=C9RAH9_AMMDK|nr:single-stranded nucleic acid binding R3H domain protein [Ammonifex degensii KC4]
MREVIKSGKTVEEAVKAALTELGVSEEEVEVEVLEEPSRGILGLFGSRPAKVRVVRKPTPGEKAKALLEEILRVMSLEGKVHLKEDAESVSLEVEGENLGVLIGRRGETLNALQYLLGLAACRNSSVKKRVLLDVGGYRKKREETLRALALRLAEKAKKRGRNIVLEPMSPQERRVIHMALKGRDDIYTFSEGEEPFRKIVIAPRK